MHALEFDMMNPVDSMFQWNLYTKDVKELKEFHLEINQPIISHLLISWSFDQQFQ